MVILDALSLALSKWRTLAHLDTLEAVACFEYKRLLCRSNQVFAVLETDSTREKLHRLMWPAIPGESMARNPQARYDKTHQRQYRRGARTHSTSITAGD
jgi:hypothetical protein